MGLGPVWRWAGMSRRWNRGLTTGGTPAACVLFYAVLLVSVPCFGKYSGGSGGSSDPFLIGEPNDIIEMSDSPEDWGRYFLMIADVNMVDYTFDRAVIGPSYITPFTGFFDGGGHIIDNLTIDATATGGAYLGLFGRIIGFATSNYSTASVLHLGLRNVNVIGGIGSTYVGGLFGYSEGGSCVDCYVIGSVSGDQYVGGMVGKGYGWGIGRSYTAGVVRGSEYVGGLSGYNSDHPWLVGGTIGLSCSASSVEGGDNAMYIGGLLGWSGDHVYDCYSTGSVTGGSNSSYIGGLCGYNHSEAIRKCYATGSVTAGDNSSSLGGLCGYRRAGSISNCFWDVEASGIGLAGDDNYGAVGKTTEQMQTLSTFTDAGWDFYRYGGWRWYMPRDSYPKLDWQRTLDFEGETKRLDGQRRRFAFQIDICNLIDETQAWTITGAESSEWITSVSPRSGISEGPGDKTTVTFDVDSTGLERGDYAEELWVLGDSGDSFIIPFLLRINLFGSGTESDPWAIRSPEDFNEFASEPGYWDDHTILETDIDLSAFSGTLLNVIGTYPQGVFTGVFDGRGHTISGFSYDGANTDNVGLFGVVDGDSAVIRDVRLIGPEVNVPGGRSVGCLVGKLHKGTVSGCSVEGGQVSGQNGVGGLVGWSYSRLSECMYSGDVSGSGFNIGGVTGINYGDIVQCSSHGQVSGHHNIGGAAGHNQGDIVQCVSHGQVSGDYTVGGLAGYNVNGGKVVASYSQAAVTGEDGVGGLVGNHRSGIVSECYCSGRVDATNAAGGLVGYVEGQYAEVIDSYWDVDGSGQATSAGGTGKSTAEMQSLSTFISAGWDFVDESMNGVEDIWMMPESGGYPMLWWELDIEYGGGMGTADDPFRIGTGGQMNEIGLHPEDWDKCFVLTANINLSSFSGTQFNIIGTDYDNAFSGVFDGQKHTISYFTYSATDSERVGLFGVVDGDGAEIRDVGLYWPRVNVPSGRFMGCLVGHLKKGVVSGCRVVEGMIWGDYAVGGLIGFSDYRVSNCSYSGEVTGYDQNIGGVVGMNNGTIIRCSARGLVGGTTNAGGITGYNQGSVLVSYSRAAVSGWNLIGGLVGEHYYGTISNCYSSGSVDGTNTAGGLVCYSRDPHTEVIDSFWDTQTSFQSSSSGGTGKSTTAMHEASTYQSAGWDFAGLPDGPSDIWLIPEGGGYPILGCEVLPEPELPAFSGGNGTAETPYLISTAGELNSIGYRPRLMDAHFRLTADIDLVGVEFFSVGNGLFPFAGVFDGDGHVVSNLSLDSTSPEYVGLFGVVSGSESKITDLHLIDPVIHSDAEGVGCIAGKLRSGTIQNCSVERGIVTGNSYVGGVAGIFAFGQIVNCRTSVDVDATGSYCGGLTGDNSNGTVEECVSAGEVTCDIAAGGLVGLNYAGGLQSAFIDNCYSTCRVSAQMGAGGLVGSHPWAGGRISNCYSTGVVSADSDFGGLVGYNPNVDEVVASFWNTETSGVAFSLGGTGLTTEEMQTMSIFTDAGWDFVGEDVNGEEDIWTICEGMNYPRFVWQVRPTDYVCPDGVGVEDLVYFAGRWLMEDEFAGAADGDGDGVVDFGDFGILVEHFLEE